MHAPWITYGLRSLMDLGGHRSSYRKSHHMVDPIHCGNVGEEGVAQALALGRPLDQTRNVNDGEVGRVPKGMREQGRRVQKRRRRRKRRGTNVARGRTTGRARRRARQCVLLCETGISLWLSPGGGLKGEDS
jgi:hypothetical protein